MIRRSSSLARKWLFFLSSSSENGCQLWTYFLANQLDVNPLSDNFFLEEVNFWDHRQKTICRARLFTFLDINYKQY